MVPDTKDWTWVVERPCPECGFDGPALRRTDVAPAIRRNAEAWCELLAGDAARPRLRPDDATWSPLEYACHVRDVHRLYDRRLALMLAEDDPTYPTWDQDETALADRYAEQDPRAVLRELVAAANRLASAFDALTPSQWERTGTRSDGARFTVETFARYLVHDPVHHVHDVVRSRPSAGP